MVGCSVCLGGCVCADVSVSVCVCVSVCLSVCLCTYLRGTRALHVRTGFRRSGSSCNTHKLGEQDPTPGLQARKCCNHTVASIPYSEPRHTKFTSEPCSCPFRRSVSQTSRQAHSKLPCNDTVDDINLHDFKDPKLWELWHTPY